MFSGRPLQPFHRHAPAYLKGVCSVYAEEYPKYLCGLGPGPYPPGAVMLLVVAEAALQAAGPFLRYGPRQFFPLFFVFAGPSLPLEVGTDAVSGGEPPVPVGGVYGIAPGDLDLGPCQALYVQNGLSEPYALVEGVEGKVLDEPDAVELELVYLGTELHRLFLLAPYNGPDVGPVQADDAAHGAHAFVEQGILLFPCLFGRGPANILVRGKGKPVLFLHAVQFQGELFGQQQQCPCQRPAFLLGLPFHLAVGYVAPFPLQVPAAGHGGPLFPAYLFEQPVQPVGTFPEQFHVGGVPHMALVAGRVHGDGVPALHVRRPVAVEGLLQIADVELPRQFRADLAHYLEIVQAVGPDVDAAEELPVQVAVEPLDQFPVRTARIMFEEHQGHLAPGGEDGPRAFFRLLQAEGRDRILPGDRPVDLSQVRFQEPVEEGPELFLLGRKRKTVLEISDSSYLGHRVFDIEPRFSSLELIFGVLFTLRYGLFN